MTELPDMDDDGFLPGIVIGVLVSLLFFWWIRIQVDESWRLQISNHGAAEFYLDENKDRQWHWLDCPKINN